MSRVASAHAQLSALRSEDEAQSVALDVLDAMFILRPGESMQFIRRRREHELPYSRLVEELRIADLGDAQPARIGGSDTL